MMTEIIEYMPLFALVAGVVARLVIPWLALLYHEAQKPGGEPVTWSWRYLLGQLVGVAIVLVALPLLIGNLNELLSWPWQPAFLAGWAAADIGRFLDKQVTALVENRSQE